MTQKLKPDLVSIEEPKDTSMTPNKRVEEIVYEFLKKKRTDHQLYLDIIDLVKEEKSKTTKENNSSFYGILSKLESSINNAGHEKRRSDDISYLWEQKKSLYANSTLKNLDEDYD